MELGKIGGTPNRCARQVFRMQHRCITMRIHHLSCGTMCPFGGRLWDGRSPVLGAAEIVCHCLLIETELGLVLVDTGFGMRDVAQPQRLSALFRIANRVRLRESDTALRQLEDLGFTAADVRHIVLTHLDFDHAGGIEDFPAPRCTSLVPSWMPRDRKIAGSIANGIGRDNGIGMSIGSAIRPRGNAGSAFHACASWSEFRRKSSWCR